MDSNEDDRIVDELETSLHYRYIPYTAISDGAVEKYAPVELGGDLERTVMPLGYREKLYERVLKKRDFKMAEDDEASR